jgi:hypothetical protein
MNRAIHMVLAGTWVAASCAMAYAQPMQTVRLRGTIEKADGNALTLKGTDGSAVRLTLTNDARVVAVVKASMADIKETTFLGSAAMPQLDGTQKALEVHIFPEEMRGTGEGHRSYPPVANSTMTNGTASGATVAGVDGSTITVNTRMARRRSSFRRGHRSCASRSGAKATSSRGRISLCWRRPRSPTARSRRTGSTSGATGSCLNSA